MLCCRLSGCPGICATPCPSLWDAWDVASMVATASPWSDETASRVSCEGCNYPLFLPSMQAGALMASWQAPSLPFSPFQTLATHSEPFFSCFIFTSSEILADIRSISLFSRHSFIPDQKSRTQASIYLVRTRLPRLPLGRRHVLLYLHFFLLKTSIR